MQKQWKLINRGYTQLSQAVELVGSGGEPEGRKCSLIYSLCHLLYVERIPHAF